jgi:hypothetical protein
MDTLLIPRLTLIVAILTGLSLPAVTRADSGPVAVVRERDAELAREPSWTPPSRAEVRDRALAWAMEAAGADSTARQVVDEVLAVWDAPERQLRGGGRRDAIDAAMETAAIVDPRAAAVRGSLQSPDGLGGATAWLADPATAPFERAAVKLWLGRELVRENRFDEAAAFLDDLDLAEAVDPAAVLFYRGCCGHWMLAQETAAESFDRLLEREAEIPVRYARLARLLRADIAALETDSLDHIARRMRDVRRRLDLGRAGPLTQRVQQGVVESLDKLIEEIESQQQQGQAASAGAGSAGEGGAAGSPMDDSHLAGGRGPGEVRARDLGSGEGWGNLPPHEREAALQQIGREYPPHYREAIEQYFKRLATGTAGER